MDFFRDSLVQIDGSHHDWFEQRAPKCCLIAFIDDATGQVLAARFWAGETTQTYLQLLHEHVAAHGCPRRCTATAAPSSLRPTPRTPSPPSSSALLQLHIEPMCARTPQAKGRVERLFQTLQDRMVKAMRLAGICSIAQANT